MSKSFHPAFAVTNRITAGLTRIERAGGGLEAVIYAMARPIKVREDSAPYGGRKL